MVKTKSVLRARIEAALADDLILLDRVGWRQQATEAVLAAMLGRVIALDADDAAAIVNSGGMR